MDSAALEDEVDIIECKVTPWFYRRRALFAGMYLIAALLFFKDGIWGYPKENEMAARKEWFEKEVLQGYDKAVAEGTQPEWSTQAKANHYPVNDQGAPLKWAAYAAAQGWPEKPKHYTQGDITQQYYWGAAGALALLVVVVNTLYHSRRKLVGAASYLIAPSGAKVTYVDAFKVDKRPWDIKGLAYVHYRLGGSGAEKKLKIDDLMYDGAGKVLDRLLAQFKGELIEKVPDEAPPEPENEADSPS